MKTCIHIPQWEAITLKPDDRVVISIRDHLDPIPPLQFPQERILFLSFMDVSNVELKAQAEAHGIRIPSSQDCEQIIKFARENEARSIIAHCAMGVSRSAAVCLALEAMGWHLANRHKAAHANEIMLDMFSVILGRRIERPSALDWEA